MPKRLSALDGLRGLAILLVLLSHSWGQYVFTFWPHIGWSGVELFFVLSGFLITGILVEAKGQPRYFANFYARRVLRIFPLYYLVIAIGFLMVLVLPTSLSPNFGIPQGQSWTYWLFLSNFSMASDGKIATSSMGVSWSLAVEEQYYLLWAPIVLLLPRRALMYLCAALYGLTFVWRIVLYGTHGPTLAGYVLLPSQMDALAVGSLIALAVTNEVNRARLVRFAPWIVGLSAAVILLIAVRSRAFYMTNELTWALSFSLYPLMYGGLLVLAVAWQNSGWAAFLRIPLMRTVGRYSYAIYLLHLPILIGMNMIGLNWMVQPDSGLPLQVAFTCLLLIASLIAGWLSWSLLEQPAQRLKRRFERGEPGAHERDAYVEGGARPLLAVGPWTFERPHLGLGLRPREVASRLAGLRPTWSAIPGAFVVVSLLCVFVLGREIRAVPIQVALVLFVGAGFAAWWSRTRPGFAIAASISAAGLLMTHHGPVLVLVMGLALLLAGLATGAIKVPTKLSTLASHPVADGPVQVPEHGR